MSIAGQEFVFRIREGDREGRKKERKVLKIHFVNLGFLF